MTARAAWCGQYHTRRFSARRPVEHDSTLYVGFDVHMDSITVAYALDTGEVEHLGKIGTSTADIDRLCKRLQGKARDIRIVYEAGPCGYDLYRQLAGKGFECMVCAPSLIPKKPGERVKTDRRDAVKLVRSLRAGDLSAVYVPSVEDEVVPGSVTRLGQRQGRSEAGPTKAEGGGYRPGNRHSFALRSTPNSDRSCMRTPSRTQRRG